MATAASPDDLRHLRRAIALAEEGVRARRGGPFGALVVRDGRVLGEGSNEVLSTLDPTAHAEVVAIRAASRAAASFDLSGATLYASCQPCPLCYSAALWARIGRVVCAATGEEAARAGFDDQRFHRELALPPERRELRVERLAVEGERRPFEQWLALPDRQLY